jgi:L-lactate dehydrogenase complex protein LldG
MDSRTKILTRLKAAQDRRGEIAEEIPDFTSPVYHPLNESMADEFKNKLELIGGQVIFCPTQKDVQEQIKQICNEREKDSVFCIDQPLQELLKDVVAVESGTDRFQTLSIGVTRCEFLVAHLGAIVISSAQISGRRLNVFPETHIVIAHQQQLTGYLEEALQNLQKKYENNLPSLISTITGPSRTADIEKTLVMGMHGPKALIVLLTTETI